MARKSVPLIERFWIGVQKSDGCWLWTGQTNGSGYGSIHAGSTSGKYLRTHRLSWEIHNGASIPDGMNVLHKCDVRRCVNPAHLFLGTQSDNLRDALSKGRRRNDAEHNPRTGLTNTQVQHIYRAAHSGIAIVEIAQRFGVKPRVVKSIKYGETWASVTRAA